MSAKRKPRPIKAADAEFIIFVVKERLPDGSYVYGVLLGELKFHAVDEAHAMALAQTISAAINEHAGNTADVVYEF